MKPVKIETFLEYSFPNSVCFNPSGTTAAYLLTRPEAASNSYSSELYVYENGESRLVRAMDSATVYIWDDDRNIIFLDNLSEEHSELFRLNIDSGCTEKLAEYRLNIKEITKLSCGRILANCRTDVNYPDLWQMTEPEAEKAIARRRAEKEAWQVIDELPYYKNGIHDSINKVRNTLFILQPETRSCLRVTSPLFQTERYCVDGDTIYFNGSSYDKVLCVFQELWSYTLGDEAPRCIYNGGKYNMRGLAMFDGRLIILGNTNPNVKLFHGEFYTVDTLSGEISSFSAYDRSIRSYVLSDNAYGGARLCAADGGKLYFVSSIDNEAWLMSLDEMGNVEPVIAHEGAFCDWDIRNGSVFFTALWDNCPLECYTAQLNNLKGSLRKVSAFHENLQRAHYIAKPQPHSFEFDGWRIDGWALMPIDFDPDKKYPMLLVIHGGPNACYSTAYMHEMQVWASEGFIVIFCNPVGSEGRGDEFMNIHGHFGDRDYACVMAFTDEMIRKYPQIDTTRLCVTGGSYGGFMTNWIVTHTDRFAAAATQRSLCNWATATLLCDNGWYNKPPQMKGDIYTGTEVLWQQSPLKYISNAKTPLLILHSEQDYSVPIEEAMQLFTALIVKGVETRLVRIKNETHELSRSGRPLARIKRLQEITDWLKAHI